MRKMMYLCLLVILMLSSTQGDHHIGHHHYDHPPQQHNPHPDHHHPAKDAKHDHEHDPHKHHDHPHHHHLHDKDHKHDHKADSQEEMLCQKISPGNFDFAFRFFKHVASKPNEAFKNIFFSPLSISAAFSMLSLGAKQNSLDQLVEGLGFNRTALTDSDIHHGFEHLFHMLNTHSVDLQLNTGSALFLREGIKFQPQFLNDAQHYYAAEAFHTDFSKSVEAVKQVNDYIEKKTNGKIVNCLASVDPDTVALLLSYIAFSGKWEKPFNSNLTKEEDFFVNENVTVKVQMMYRNGRYKVHLDTSKGFQFVEIPYKGNTVMILILPADGKMDEVIQSLTLEKIMNLHKTAFVSNINLHVPKFSIKASYKLHELLPEMGISDIFSDLADLSGIVESPKLKISQAQQTAVIKVDETGTEAAAVTTIEAMPMSLPFTVKLDRPFLTLICNHDTKTLLFMGKVINPVQSSHPK
ncbi:alpha-1-antitrypsin homolog isoform X2 [Protopterus annectens]|nr:alpha-1-antitrypsin homolog isoform X2 [Protopterus annectens]XP_043930531.1 alpha-1-antitrypsin homolog isoform X2 [Protopterus annectens]